MKSSLLLLLLRLWAFHRCACGQSFSGDPSSPSDSNRSISGDTTKKVVVFGTSEGYDVGGVAPLCWDSLYSTNSSSAATTTNRLDELQQQLFSLAENNENPVSLLKSCYDGTSFTIKPLDLEQSLTDKTEIPDMYLLHAYTFRLQIQADLLHIFAKRSNETGSLAKAPLWASKLKIYCRIHLCHTEKQGFCNPRT
jgi:hypothetical protein